MTHKEILNETREWARRIEPIMDRLAEITEKDSKVEDFRMEHGVIINEGEASGQVRIIIFCKPWEEAHDYANRSIYLYIGRDMEEHNWKMFQKLIIGVNLLAKKEYELAFDKLGWL